MAAHRSAPVHSLVQGQNSRPVLLGTFAPTVATNFSLPAWSIEAIQATPGDSQYVPVPAGAQLIISSTADINLRLTPAGSGLASGTVTYAADSGAQTITLAGVQVSFSSGASVTLTAQAAVAALTANLLIKNAFNVSSSAGVVTIKRLVGGTGGNVSLAVTGTGATRSGALLTGGTDTTAATTAANGILVPAKTPFVLYKLAGDACLDVLGAATVNVFVGV